MNTPGIPLKVAALGALLIALWNPGLPWHGTETPIVLLDRSDSMAGAADDRAWPQIAERIRRMTGAGTLEVIEFAENVAPALNVAVGETLPPSPVTLRSSGTNLEAGLEAAIAGTMSTQPIFIVSDGIQTLGDATPVLETAKGRRQPVFVLDVGALATAVPGPRIVEVAVPREVRATTRFTAMVRLFSATPTVATLEVFDHQRRLASRRVTLAAGSSIYPIELRAARTGPLQLQVRLADGADPGLHQDYDVVVNVRDKTPLLFVSTADSLPPTALALRLGNWQVMHRQPASLARGIPSGIGTIVLDNVAAREVPDIGWRRLEDAVSLEGAGLVILGGNNAYGAGGYRGSRLETLSPVTSQSGMPGQPVSAVFLLDRSGSMERSATGIDRFGRAREAILRTARNMARSEIGVVTFDTEARVLLPLGHHARVEQVIAEALQDDRPSGGTLLAGGLRLALNELMAGTNERRILVVVSDGFAADDSFEAALDSVADNDIEVVALAVGHDADIELLRRLTDRNNGKLLNVSDVTQVPAFIDDALETNRSAMQMIRTNPVPAFPLPFLAGNTEWPALDGYMVTRAREDATVYLATPGGDPLLAAWQYGLGRVVAIPGSLNGFSNGWRRWRSWDSFIGGLVEWAAGSPAVANATIALSDEDSTTATIVVDVLGRTGDWLSEGPAMLTARLMESASSVATGISVPRVAPGRYRTWFTPPRTGVYRLATQVPGGHVLTHFYYRARSERDTRESSLDRWLDAGLVRPATTFRTSAAGGRTLFLILALVLYGASLVTLIPQYRKR